jgi:hypothetical protein
MQGPLVPLRLQFHAAIRPIAHPAAEAQFAGPALGGRPIAHPLHIPEHRQVPALLGGCLAVALRLGEEAALGGRGAAGALDAARREGITGKPAQCR